MKYEEFINQINAKTEGKPILFFSNDPERGIGPLSILKNYRVICIDNNEIVNYIDREKIFCLGQKIDTGIYRSSSKLANHPLIDEYINAVGDFYPMTFKISRPFEETFEGKTILNTSAQLNEDFEGKISQYNILSKFDVNFPKTFVDKLSNFEYIKLVEQLNSPFILQYNRGHTGQGTLIIESEDQFEKIKSTFPEREVRIAKFIDTQYSYTLIGSIYNKQTYWGGLSYQITGIDGLTDNPKATVGNDFGFREGINEKVLDQIDAEVAKIGKALIENNYQGLFGIDLLVKDEKVYIIEVNARQTQSVSLFTQYQILNNEIPLLLLHIAEFLGINIELNSAEYNKNAKVPKKLSQIYVRSKLDEFAVKGYVKPGIYRLQSDDAAMIESQAGNKDIIYLDEEKDKPLIYQKDGYSVLELEANGGILVLAKMTGQNVKKGDELARLQLLDNALSPDGSIKAWIKESLLAIENYLR